MTIKHPREINALVNLRRQPHDFLVAVKITARCQHAAEQQGCVNRRNFALPFARARPDIDKVIKPALFVFLPVGKKTQRHQHTLTRFPLANPAAFHRNAPRRQAETSCCDAGNIIDLTAVSARTVSRQAGVWIGLLLKIPERTAREVFKKNNVLLRQPIWR
ncbi:MAG: hypothetical protein ACREEM_11010 [Blastocatellia bacterium]